MNLILILACIEILFTEIFLVYGIEILPVVELSCEMVCSFHEARTLAVRGHLRLHYVITELQRLSEILRVASLIPMECPGNVLCLRRILVLGFPLAGLGDPIRGKMMKYRCFLAKSRIIIGHGWRIR